MNNFSPLQSYLGGLQAGEQQQVRGLVKSLSGSDNPQMEPEFARLLELDPQRAMQIINLSEAQNASVVNQQLRDTKEILYHASNGDVDSIVGKIQSIAPLYTGERKERLGGLLNMAQQGDLEGIASNMTNYLKLFDPTFKVEGGEKEPAAVQSSEILADGTTITVNKDRSRTVIDPRGNIVSGEQAANVVRAAKEYERERKREEAKLERENALLKARASGMVERESADIKSGLEAAEAVPTIKRGLVLLDLVETGKPEQFINWAEKQLGIQGADQGELENILGKRILQQLKPIFGSQFTAQEGQWLKSMEADYGKSTEVNRRLLSTGMQLLEMRVKQGLDAANSANDTRSAKNINDWYNFEITPPSQSGSGLPTQTPERIEQGEGLTPEEQAELQRLRAELGQ